MISLAEQVRIPTKSRDGRGDEDEAPQAHLRLPAKEMNECSMFAN